MHPGLPGTAYPFAGLCGAGVAFKLAWALCQRASQSKKVGERMRNFLLQAVGLAALGTVADVVPLVDENRVLVRHGLTSLRERPGLGIAALLQVDRRSIKQPPLSSEDIAFTLRAAAERRRPAGPGHAGRRAVDDRLGRTGRRRWPRILHELNGSRESLERSIYLAANKQATEQFDPEGDAALVLADRGWHPGVIGIVAAAGREVSSAGRADRARRAGRQAGHRLGAQRAGLQSARGAGRLLGAPGQPRRARGGGRAEDRRGAARRRSARSFASTPPGEISLGARVAELRIDAEVPFSALTRAAVSRSSGWPRSATPIRGRCCARRT